MYVVSVGAETLIHYGVCILIVGHSMPGEEQHAYSSL